jgi:hypothetical protein
MMWVALLPSSVRDGPSIFPQQPKPEEQVDRFIETACQVECDEDEERFEEEPDKTRRRRQRSSRLKVLSVAGLAKLGLIGCLGLAACAPANWNKFGATQADHDRDVYECQRAAQQGALFGLKALAMQNSFKHCMTARGYVVIQ